MFNPDDNVWDETDFVRYVRLHTFLPPESVAMQDDIRLPVHVSRTATSGDFTEALLSSFADVDEFTPNLNFVELRDMCGSRRMAIRAYLLGCALDAWEPQGDGYEHTEHEPAFQVGLPNAKKRPFAWKDGVNPFPDGVQKRYDDLREMVQRDPEAMREMAARGLPEILLEGEAGQVVRETIGAMWFTFNDHQKVQMVMGHEMLVAGAHDWATMDAGDVPEVQAMVAIGEHPDATDGGSIAERIREAIQQDFHVEDMVETLVGRSDEDQRVFDKKFAAYRKQEDDEREREQKETAAKMAVMLMRDALGKSRPEGDL